MLLREDTCMFAYHAFWISQLSTYGCSCEQDESSQVFCALPGRRSMHERTSLTLLPRHDTSEQLHETRSLDEAVADSSNIEHADVPRRSLSFHVYELRRARSDAFVIPRTSSSAPSPYLLRMIFKIGPHATRVQGVARGPLFTIEARASAKFRYLMPTDDMRVAQPLGRDSSR